MREGAPRTVILPRMPTDPRDPLPPRPDGLRDPSDAGPPEGDRPQDSSFFRRRPRPLSGDRPSRDDVETVSHIERVPRPEPIARIGPAPRLDADELRRPAPWDSGTLVPAPLAEEVRRPAPWESGTLIPAAHAEEPPPRREAPRVEPPPRVEAPPRAEPGGREFPLETTDEVRRAARDLSSPRDFPPTRDLPRERDLPPARELPPPRDLTRDLPRESTDEIRRGAIGNNVVREYASETNEDFARSQPKEPRTWQEAGLDPVFGEQLVLRYLAGVTTESARQVANELCLSLPLMKELLEQLKQSKLLQHRGSTPMGDFIYEVTEAGRSKALDYKRLCAYVGPAPVPWSQYLQSVRDQALRSRSPTPADLERAFEDLIVSEDILERLGPAITSGRAMFLHGDPGNGKTSIAERITRCFGDDIWIPHALLIDGHLVKLYDPATHEAVEAPARPQGPADKLDRRWIRIKRPTVVAGGELTLEMLEIQVSSSTNIGEAPLQLKANCGTLVIDDFGRQRIEPQVLLNRWIFPLERRIDFLKLPDGRKISAPFDPLLIFSTNLEPKDLVDEAFLRRIPYKIQVSDPTEHEFVRLLEAIADKLEIRLVPGACTHLVLRHYRERGRPLRFCHPRDLLLQVCNQCAYDRRARVATAQDFDRAVMNYFGAL
jgi:hypothetical protein